ncbi:hypothetical protein, partial [Rhizobium leguminosarum]|uniref:hypothetical protein n=1 Tax=Rhizobium leguminosarum TaxID=384 RepID=UPI003F98B9F9
PMVLLQSVVAAVFMERHWQMVTERLSLAVTRDIAAIIEIETRKLALRFGAIGGDGNAEAVLGEITIEKRADAGVVIDHQQMRRIVGNT